MKIRTRLVLSLLPALLSGILLIFLLLYLNQQTDLSIIEIAILGIALLAVIATASLYYISGKISTHVQKLNNSALTIAAGRYGESIHATGPKELKELANTLNTLSECLLENINRLNENSKQREQMYGEAECARLLQLQMLQKNIDECSSDAIAVKSISFSSAITRGFLVDFPTNLELANILNIHLAEAKSSGFEGMYRLLTQYKSSKDHRLSKYSLRLTLDREHATITSQGIGCVPPYIWSINDSSLHLLKGTYPVAQGDFIFLMNRGFMSFFKEPLRIMDLLTKVLKYFAQDGLETTAAMLNKEIAFAIKCKDLQEDLHLLCIQVLKPTLD